MAAAAASERGCVWADLRVLGVRADNKIADDADGEGAACCSWLVKWLKCGYSCQDAIQRNRV